MSKAEHNDRMSDYLFSDLYFNQSRNKMPKIRGLVHKSGRDGTHNGRLIELPRPLLGDVQMMSDKVISHNKEHRAREFVIEHDDVRYRCAMIAAPSGMSSTKSENVAWCLRRIAETVPDVTDMGLPVWLSDIVRSSWIDRGLTLIAGPFGSGKTTLASASFIEWVRHSKEVGVALEDPPEVDFSRQDLKGGEIYQIDLVDRSMAEAIRFARRWAPRYVLIGEIRSPEAAVEMLSMAKSGPAVISTIHASDPVSAVTQLIQFASGRMSENDARQSVSAALTGVLFIEGRGSANAAKYLSVGGSGDHLIRNAINDGKYTSLNEEIDRQMILRMRARSGETS